MACLESGLVCKPPGHSSYPILNLIVIFYWLSGELHMSNTSGIINLIVFCVLVIVYPKP